METFFALLQKNVLDRQRWSTREQLRLAIVIWIERTYIASVANADLENSLRSRLDNQTDRNRGLNRSTPLGNRSGGSPVGAHQ